MFAPEQPRDLRHSSRQSPRPPSLRAPSNTVSAIQAERSPQPSLSSSRTQAIVVRSPGTRSTGYAPTHRRSSEPRPPERWRNSAWHPHSARRRQPSGVQTFCKRCGPPLQTSCKRPTVETPRNRAKRLTRSPVFSGFLAHVRWISRNMNLSGRQDLNLRPPGPQPGALPDCATPRGVQSGRRESNPP
jgi:hypothetical protein